MQSVQDLRDKKQVPGALQLHQYANLYFHTRNPMLFKRLNEVDSLCILRISKQVLAVPGAIVTDQNAASDYVRFLGDGCDFGQTDAAVGLLQKGRRRGCRGRELH